MKLSVFLIFMYAWLGGISASAQPVFAVDQGVVFTADYAPPIELKDKAEAITPDLEDIATAEAIFKDQIAAIDKAVKKRKYYKNYKRQYLGYLNNRGEKVILIQLLNFKCKRKAQKQFTNWQQEFVIGFGEYYEKNLRVYEVNLNQQQLLLF